MGWRGGLIGIWMLRLRGLGFEVGGARLSLVVCELWRWVCWRDVVLAD